MKSSETVQRRPRKRLSCALVPLLILLMVVPPRAFADWEAWEDGRAYTKMLKKAALDAAKEAVALAAAVVAAAAADLAAAQAAVAAAGGTGVATTAATLARLAAAEAALAAATATLAAAKAAAAAAAAAVAGAAIGTYAGQGLRGIWSWCWDPVCDLTATKPDGPIYVQATDDEIDALIEDLVSANGFKDIDFKANPVAKEFLAMGIGQFLNAARGAAAATDHRPAEVHAAMCDMQADMYTYRDVTEAFAGVLATTSFEDPSADLAAARADFDAAVAEVMEVCNPEDGDDCEAIEAYLNDATASFQSAQDEIATFDFPTLVGKDNSVFPDLSLAEFHEFMEDCAAKGESCLPQAEIDLVNALAEAAGTYSPSQPSLGVPIAEYDAMGDTGGRESALFDPDTGLINLAELLEGAATELSGSGSMFNIDLAASPLAAEADYDPAKCPK